MDEKLQFLKGRKSYIIAGIMVILGCLEGLKPDFITPEWVYGILAGLFGISLRAGVTKIKDVVKPPE